MQRQFSNRGEPRAEVTAAKMLAGRKPSIQSQFIAQSVGRRSPSNGSRSQRK